MKTGHLISIVGIVLNVLSLLGGGLYALAKVDGRLSVLNSAHEVFVDRLNKMDAKLEQVNTAMIRLATQEERMSSQDRRMQELSSRLDAVQTSTKRIASKR